jgi:hypothetical protein
VFIICRFSCICYVTVLSTVDENFSEREREREGERLLAAVAGSPVPSVLNLNCYHTYIQGAVGVRRGCIERVLRGKPVSSR